MTRPSDASRDQHELPAAASVSAAAPARCRLLLWPRAPRPSPRQRRPRRPRRADLDGGAVAVHAAPVTLPARRGAPRRPDRVVVLHRPPRGRRRPPLGLRARHLPDPARRRWRRTTSATSRSPTASAASSAYEAARRARASQPQPPEGSRSTSAAGGCAALLGRRPAPGRAWPTTRSTCARPRAEAAGPPRRRPGHRSARPATRTTTRGRAWRSPARSTTTASRPGRGPAWFDQQWGNFLVMGGGWDWFSLQLDDAPRSDARPAQPDGQPHRLRHLRRRRTARSDTTPGQFEVRRPASWTSPRTGMTYPSGWRCGCRAGARPAVTPVLPTRSSTRAPDRVVYWEGAVESAGTIAGRPIAGQGLRRIDWLRLLTACAGRPPPGMG